MRTKDIVIGALAIVAIVFIYLFFDERQKNNKLLEENADLQNDKLKLLKENLSVNKEITPEVKKQLLALIEEYKSKHPKVSI